jgi:nitroreductase
MQVYEAVATRRSVRAYLDKEIPLALLRDILSAAARAPSGGNLQPWRVYALAGTDLQAFKMQMVERVAESPRGEATEYPVYPENLGEPYAGRRFSVGEQLYAAISIPRGDKAGRLRQFAQNFQFFGAPVGLFCFVDRQMGSAQWSDLGMFLQTLMLLLRENGLDSCAQEAWSLFPRTVSTFLNAPSELMLFCGMAVGHADPAASINQLVTQRAVLDEFVTFQGFA